LGMTIGRKQARRLVRFVRPCRTVATYGSESENHRRMRLTNGETTIVGSEHLVPACAGRQICQRVSGGWTCHGRTRQAHPFAQATRKRGHSTGDNGQRKTDATQPTRSHHQYTTPHGRNVTIMFALGVSSTQIGAPQVPLLPREPPSGFTSCQLPTRFLG